MANSVNPFNWSVTAWNAQVWRSGPIEASAKFGAYIGSWCGYLITIIPEGGLKGVHLVFAFIGDIFALPEVYSSRVLSEQDIQAPLWDAGLNPDKEFTSYFYNFRVLWVKGAVLDKYDNPRTYAGIKTGRNIGRTVIRVPFYLIVKTFVILGVCFAAIGDFATYPWRKGNNDGEEVGAARVDDPLTGPADVAPKEKTSGMVALGPRGGNDGGDSNS